MSDDRSRVQAALEQAGIAGAHDFGRFVSNTDFFEPSAFDERGAMPVLLDVLPTLTDEKVVSAVAGHLRRPWARPVAFDALLPAFRVWASRAPTGAGWHLGDALGSAADERHVSSLLDVARDQGFSAARQMVVGALWRFRKQGPGVEDALRDLCTDPSVCFHAMSAYRRTVGPVESLSLLRTLEGHSDPQVQRQARKQAKTAEQALLKQRG